MKRRFFLLLLVVACTLMGGYVFAQDRDSNETSYNFADDVVRGELVRPDGELIEGQRNESNTSLINIRVHFIDKMIESVEDI
jgi:hypothetical protein